MPRPPCCRRVSSAPLVALFKPVDQATSDPDQIAMTLDELEAVRLADLEQLYQEQAAERMGVSRATFGRILTTARRKIADVLVTGKALRIEGGVVAVATEGVTRCKACRARSGEAGEGAVCPRCRCPLRAEALRTKGCRRSDGGGSAKEKTR